MYILRASNAVSGEKIVSKMQTPDNMIRAPRRKFFRCKKAAACRNTLCISKADNAFAAKKICREPKSCCPVSAYTKKPLFHREVV